ncbi:Family of uncharacterised function (DUF633) [Acholeplasma oculi]|uniref:tRNA methyltransferase TrmK n=1 Tax=Acholeplasma oculi TaxID=35623 RepID=A0A061AB27_9MOLU|nr:class I SAM-dependent methyltransferase [Acholeplasma oculi]CDR30609.1 tRNA methyltransferase TrmK [Acholeplasma oculi]SKC46389.1 tRNA (adenine22-N1)-methyltransferase [Acholeplasma oculi]SUT89331.1 Family of uncharacterised function (DUF633) [Acholeplasma oculi]
MSRIEFLASLTKGYTKVIDVGTDHGKVLKIALDLNYIKEGIATDINKGPLESAKKNLEGYPVKFFLTDGFKGVKEDFDLGIITGMGSRLICSILKDAPKHKTYILGAHEKLDILRKWLQNHHFKIVDEYVIHDGFYYCFMKVETGEMRLSESEIFTGPILKLKQEALPYFEHKAKYYLGLSQKAKHEKSEEYYKIYTFYNDILK